MHRDVKPANILLDATLHARLADTGFALHHRDGMHAIVEPSQRELCFLKPRAPFSNPMNTCLDECTYAYLMSVACTAYMRHLTARVRVHELSRVSCGPTRHSHALAQALAIFL